MRVLYRIVLTAIFFFAAIACYVFGIPAGGAAFLVLGIAFESMFWLGLFGRKRSA